jgi:Oxidoreductase family, NAD-binding Rossmann fold
MADRIRLGFIGANVRATWAAQSHFPALLASPDVELTAVCTTRRETAEAARAAFGAKLAFTDFREMVVSKEIDAVAVVVRVPAHYEPSRAAICRRSSPAAILSTWADVSPVRRGDPDRTGTEPVADLRHRGRPASFPRYDQTVIGYGTGAASA